MDITSVRYINLARNWHRNLLISALLKKLPYKVLRCPGTLITDFNDPGIRKYLSLGFEEYLDPNRIKGVAGCWIAHSHVLEEVTERSGITVVLEDDFVCQRGFFTLALKMVKEFNRDFDVILFDTWGKGPLDNHKISDNIYRPRNFSHPFYSGSHCLFVNNSRIPKILDLKLNSKVKDYDGYLIANDNIVVYIFYTGLCGSRNIGSDIYNDWRSKYGIAMKLVIFTVSKIRELLALVFERKQRDRPSDQV